MGSAQSGTDATGYTVTRVTAKKKQESRRFYRPLKRAAPQHWVQAQSDVFAVESDISVKNQAAAN
jgi:hypothetical protein